MATTTVLPTTVAPGAASYWTGNDGNIYYGSGLQGAGVQNEGKALNTTGTGFDAANLSGIATQIANPAGATGVLGGGAAAAPSVSQDTIHQILASIAAQVSKNQSDFQSASNQNAGTDAQAAANYNSQNQNNINSHDSALGNAQEAAAQGEQGLKAILASMGALGGTGQVLAGRAVANTANNDIGGADKTFQTNATALEGAHNDFLNAKSARDTTLQNNLTNDNASANNQGYQHILDDARTMGDKATYNKFLPNLLQSTSAPQAIVHVPTTFNPASVASYAPNSGLNVTSKPAVTQSTTTPVNSALYVKKNS